MSPEDFDNLPTTDLRRLANGASIGDAVDVYLANGWAAVPLKGKDPSVNGADWQKRAYTKPDFKAEQNVGIQLGLISGNLTDIDLDSYEARELADVFLPPTEMRHGRSACPESHRWYQTDVPLRTKQYKDVPITDSDGKKKRQMIVELRSSEGDSGFQTMVPPSIHPDTKEKLSWSAYGKPAKISGRVLQQCVRRLAGGAILTKNFPSVGGRHDFALALSGALLRNGWSVDEAEDVVFAVCAVGGSDNPEKHMKCVQSTATRIAAGQPATGIPALKEFLGEDVLAKVIDWFDLDHRPIPADLKRLPSDGNGNRRVKTVIRLNAEEDEVIDEMIVALKEDPTIFVYNTYLAEVMITGESIENPLVIRPPRTPFVRQVPRPRLQTLLCSAARFEKYTEKDGWIDAHPPAWLVAGVETQGNWPGLHKLTALGDSPVFLSDGSVPTTPGYHKQSGLYISSNISLNLLHSPTKDDAVAAAKRLLSLVDQFAFVEECHRSTWLCSLLTILSRFAFNGCVPLTFIEAAVAAAGKSLLVDVISMIAFGRAASRSSYSPEEEEMRKHITTIVRNGDRLVLFDNIENGSLFESSALDRVLTGGTWSDRLLGGNEDFTAPVYTTFFATGNNLTIGGDLVRRLLHIRLEPTVEQPELLKDFKIPRLLEYTLQNRAALLSDAFTILRAYHNADRPNMGLEGWGSFEEWSDLPRSATVYCDLEDPGSARDALSCVDQGRYAGAELLTALEELFAARKVKHLSAKEIWQACADPKCTRLKEALEELCSSRKGDVLTPKKILWVLRKQRGRVFNDVSIQVVNEKAHEQMWFIRK